MAFIDLAAVCSLVPQSFGAQKRKTAPPKGRRFVILSHVALKTLL